VNGVKKLRAKLQGGWLAWLAFGCALVGGVTATASWVGDWVSAIVGVFWWWMPFVLLVVVGLTVLLDLVTDGIPNRKATYLVILWPSLALSVDGKLGHTLRGWIDAVNAYLDRTFAAWLTDSPRGSAAVLTAVALMTIAAAVLYAEKYAKKAARPRPRLGPAAVVAPAVGPAAPPGPAVGRRALG
jgi:hypothetical protein